MVILSFASVACTKCLFGWEQEFAPTFLYRENHALDAWFNKAYGDEQEIPATKNEWSANCSMPTAQYYVTGILHHGINDTIDYNRKCIEKANRNYSRARKLT